MHAELEQERLEEAWQLATAQAWMTAALSRQKRLPSLASVMRKGSRPLTDDEKAWAEEIRRREAAKQEQLQQQEQVDSEGG